jgi:hypothetical protein
LCILGAAILIAGAIVRLVPGRINSPLRLLLQSPEHCFTLTRFLIINLCDLRGLCERQEFSFGILVFWSFGILVFWLRAAIVYTWSGDFSRRSTNVFSTRANKFAPPAASSIARTLLHSNSIFNNKPLRSPRSLREAISHWSFGLLVFWCFG